MVDVPERPRAVGYPETETAGDTVLGTISRFSDAYSSSFLANF
ncbi:Uncharacterised protein [Mycobacterium tuberculosis]|nr:Uncharacterised protein [Mycobacterium tuberculosis]